MTDGYDLPISVDGITAASGGAGTYSARYVPLDIEVSQHQGAAVQEDLDLTRQRAMAALSAAGLNDRVVVVGVGRYEEGGSIDHVVRLQVVPGQQSPTHGELDHALGELRFRLRAGDRIH